jgi:glycosyltransferase involved in cell wall biosynthesis
MADRVLVAVPAHNEEATIGSVVAAIRQHAPGFDLLVIDDGSHDGTTEILRRLGVRSARHACNLGYGRSVQTAIKYARQRQYDALITFDADGQHRAADLQRLYNAFIQGRYDLLIGSRFIRWEEYKSPARTRRIGMWLFSLLVRALTGRRIYDTSSGFRIFSRQAFDLVGDQPFLDFHAETIVLLLRAGYNVGEDWIIANERRAGTSMYSALSVIKYPLKTSLLVLLAVLGTGITTRK